MKLYTVKEAAKVIGVSTNTLYKYLDDGKIHAARGSALQGRFRIPESALEEFLGIKFTQPEVINLKATTIEPSHGGVEGPISDRQSPERGSRSHLPTKLARFFLVLALIAILVDLFVSTRVTLVGQLPRLLFLLIMLLLAYQEGGYHRAKSI